MVFNAQLLYIFTHITHGHFRVRIYGTYKCMPSFMLYDKFADSQGVTEELLWSCIRKF